MIFSWLLLKFKSFLFLFPNVFRKALCCIRPRKASFSEPLTHVVSSLDTNNEAPTWSEWDEDGLKEKPKTVQDYIQQYREQTIKARNVPTDETPDKLSEYLDDMTPKICKPTKILIGSSDLHNRPNKHVANRLNVADDSTNAANCGELGVWYESNGWETEEQKVLDEAQKVLREKKRLERESKLWEQHQKRLEKASKTLGSKLVS